jgi:hypothetical protein
MASDNPITYEEFLDNYEFKVAKRILLREYPWIKDVRYLNPDDINKWNLIFVDIFINPYELSEQEGWTVANYVTLSIERGEEFWSPYLTTFFTKSIGEEGREMVIEMETTLEDIHKSSAIPADMKLPGHRKLNIGTWHTIEGLTVPTSYVDWRNHIE